MKSRTVIILWIVAIVLGVFASIVQFGSDDHSATHTTLSPGDKILPGLPIREISKVTVTQGDDVTQLVKLEGDSWGVTQRDNYPVNYEKLRNLLGALGELEVTQGYPSASEHLARFGLMENSETPGERALRVTMEKADGTTVADVFLGKFSGTSRTSGRFMRISSDDSGVYAVGETFPGISATPKDWLGTDFLKIEKIKSISLRAPGDPAFKPWKLIRHPNTDGTVNENGQFKLDGMTEKETMQLTSTGSLRNLLSYSSFQDILTEEQAGEKADPDAKLKREAVISTFDGLTYTITFWPQKEQPKDTEADPRLPAVQTDYLLTVKVSADIQEKRAPGEEEKPEEAKKKDAEHAAKVKALKEKLTTIKGFQNRIYQVSQNIVSPLLKKRTDFAKTIKPKPTAVSPPVRIPTLPAPGQENE